MALGRKQDLHYDQEQGCCRRLLPEIGAEFLVPRSLLASLLRGPSSSGDFMKFPYFQRMQFSFPTNILIVRIDSAMVVLNSEKSKPEVNAAAPS